MQLAINHMVYRDREFESTTVKGSCLQFGLDSSSSWAGLVILIVCSVCPLQFVFHVNLLIYDVVKEQWILFFIYRTHCRASCHVRGAAIDPTVLLPKRSSDLLWGLHALKATSKDSSQQS